ncbi:MAG: hypothetical protein HZB77_00140 [Chloroflexi bacterium]|nr:hypothetical protein [Chloroflexota bacterium]
MALKIGDGTSRLAKDMLKMKNGLNGRHRGGDSGWRLYSGQQAADAHLVGDKRFKQTVDGGLGHPAFGHSKRTGRCEPVFDVCQKRPQSAGADREPGYHLRGQDAKGFATTGFSIAVAAIDTVPARDPAVAAVTMAIKIAVQD